MKHLLYICVLFVLAVCAPAQADSLPEPQKGQLYPDMELIDQTGHRFKLSDLKGKIIVVEPVGMNCPASQAFSGAHDVGSYQNNAVQNDLQSVPKLIPEYAQGMPFPNREVVFVQILFYDMNLGQAQPEDARKWAEHFKLEKAKNEIVAVPAEDMRSTTTYKQIPGLQLIDQNFVLRSDSSGHHPKDNMYDTLIPMIPKLVR
ncbi:MAG: hypothetical protein JKY71_11315 [Alphaproteobacteria bacterium]|nr:hypothetical protein [Alphaproteobacteria bacterium]